MTFNNKTIDELHDLLVKKEISAVELTKATLEDIKSREGAVDAFLTITEDAALAQAAALDEKGIDADNVMAGIPLAVKDNISTKGILTTAASKMLYNYEPIFDATSVAQAYAKDMIIVGKTNMDEFAMGGSNENSAFKPTKNAWDQTKVPGGSSGGSAAAVASGQVRLSLGSDTGGSIRQPAAFNGIVGMKPTYGRVSRFGLIAFGSSLDQIGPVGKNTEDCAALLQVIAGHDQKDSTSLRRELPKFGLTSGEDLKGMKFGVPEEYMAEGMEEGVRNTFLASLKLLEELGADVEFFSMKTTEYVIPAYYIIASAKASSNLERFDGVKYGFRAEEYKGLHDMYRKTRTQGFGKEVKRRIMLGSFVLSSGYYDAYYLKALKAKAIIKKEFDQAFEKYDVILAPVAPHTAQKLGESLKDPLAMYLGDIYTVAVNLCALPAISLPGGLDGRGLPVGFQMIGPCFGENTLIRAASVFENARGTFPSAEKGGIKI